MERNRKGDIYSLQSRKITNRYPSSLLKSNRRTTTQATKLPNDTAVKSLLPRNIADEVVLRKKRKKICFHSCNYFVAVHHGLLLFWSSR
jgi:hypothetical protein